MISDKIVTLRKQRKWTQEQLAEKLNIKQPQLNRWETGKSVPTIDGLKKISKIFNIAIDTLVFNENDLKTMNPQDKALISQLKDFEKLNDQEKQIIINLINTFIIQKVG